jgi:hypothetical protein
VSRERLVATLEGDQRRRKRCGALQALDRFAERQAATLAVLEPVAGSDRQVVEGACRIAAANEIAMEPHLEQEGIRRHGDVGVQFPELRFRAASDRPESLDRVGGAQIDGPASRGGGRSEAHHAARRDLDLIGAEIRRAEFLEQRSAGATERAGNPGVDLVAIALGDQRWPADGQRRTRSKPFQLEKQLPAREIAMDAVGGGGDPRAGHEAVEPKPPELAGGVERAAQRPRRGHARGTAGSGVRDEGSEGLVLDVGALEQLIETFEGGLEALDDRRRNPRVRDLANQRAATSASRQRRERADGIGRVQHANRARRQGGRDAEPTSQRTPSEVSDAGFGDRVSQRFGKRGRRLAAGSQMGRQWRRQGCFGHGATVAELVRCGAAHHGFRLTSREWQHDRGRNRDVRGRAIGDDRFQDRGRRAGSC